MSELVPREATWEILKKTRNPAANNLLASLLRSTSSTLRRRCLTTLLDRKDPQADQRILENWELLDSSGLEFLSGHIQRLDRTVRLFLEGASLNEKRLGLAATVFFKLGSGLKSILPLVVDTHHALQPQASRCLMDLCVHWGGKARQSGDSFAMRGPMLEALYTYVVDYPQHQNKKILDAWLALCNWDDSLQRGLIADPSSAVYRELTNRLCHNTEPYSFELLAGYLPRATTPKLILNAICENTDARFATELTRLVDTQLWSAARRRLRELPTLACLKSNGDGEMTKNFDFQRRLWLLISVSETDVGRVLNGAVRLARLGSSEGRQAAAEVIMNCRLPEMDVLVSELQRALGGFAQPGSAGIALLEISKWIPGPSVVLKKAALELFKDWNLENLINQIPKWPNALCKAMAHVVGLSQENLTDTLVSAMKSPSPKRRMAALQATHLLNLPEAVSQFLLPMLEDPRLEVRVQVIELLGDLATNLMDEYLPDWLNDASTDIQDAAKRAVRRRERRLESIATGEEVVS
jgi:hypothetical protein